MDVMLAFLRPVTPSRRALEVLALFVACFLLRSIYVSLFGCDLPQWDQWDAEGDRLLRAWVQGSWAASDLFSSHNEHRIALTRLISLAVFKLNADQWDNLVEAYVNAGIFSASLVMLWVLLNRNASTSTTRTVSALLVLLLAALPYSWENALVGFQSQFYLMAIGSIAMIAVVSCMAPSRQMVAYLVVIGVVALFTMASGLIGAVACIGVIILRSFREPLGHKFLLVSIGALALITLVGLLLVPSLPGHDIYKAQGLVDHVRALATVLMWPLEPQMQDAIRHVIPMLALAAVMWSPTLIWLWRFFRERQATSQEIFAIGVSMWVVLQAVAIAHSRGHAIVAMASRYMDIPAIGVVVNAWLALVAISASGATVSRIGLGAAAIFATVFGAGIFRRTPGDLHLAIERSAYTARQTANVRQYIRTGDPANLDKPFFTIPYPDAKRLQSLLDDPVIRHMLPISVRQPLWMPMDIGDFKHADLPPVVMTDADTTAIGTYPHTERDSYQGTMTSPALRSSFPLIVMETVGGRIGRGQLTMSLIDTRGEHSIELRRQSGLQWNRFYMSTPSGAFHVTATDRASDNWMGLTAPIECGVLSEWSHRFQDFTDRHVARFGITLK